MQKLELFKALLLNNTGKLGFFQAQVAAKRFVQTSVVCRNDEQKTKYEEYEQPYKNLNIKGLEDVGILKKSWSWPKYNRIVYPPQVDGQPKVTPFVHHMRTHIKYPPKKMWLIASMIRGMSIDEAIKQLSFHKQKGADIIRETLLEAQELAVKEHNIEFKSNLWVSYSNSAQALNVKGLRKHKGLMYGILKYRYCHYYVRLEEGLPPENFWNKYETYEQRAENYINYLRNRQIVLGL